MLDALKVRTLNFFSPSTEISTVCCVD